MEFNESADIVLADDRLGGVIPTKSGRRATERPDRT
jgi:hypothetical protein